MAVPAAIAALTTRGGGAGFLDVDEVAVDAHVPTLLHLLPPDAHVRLTLHAHPLVTSGCLVLQDKASAFTVAALMDGLGDADVASWAENSEGGAPAISEAAGGKRRRALSTLAASGDDAEPLHPPPGGRGSAKHRRLDSAAAAAVTASSADEAAAEAARSQQQQQQRQQAVHAIDACAAPGNKTSQLLAALCAAFPDPLGGAAAGSRGSAAGGGGGGPGTAAAAARCASSSRVRVLAFDRAPDRAALLHSRMRQACGEAGVGDGPGALAVMASDPDLAAAATGAAHPPPLVETSCADFLSLDPAHPRFARVRLVLLDPSCSGSGMLAKEARRQARAAGGEAAAAAAATAVPAVDVGDRAGGRSVVTAAVPTDEEVRRLYTCPQAADAAAGAAATAAVAAGTTRLSSLAAFQLRALVHATRFPAARRVAYSTCSLWAREDEEVVAAALAEANAALAIAAAAAARAQPGGPAAAAVTAGPLRSQQLTWWQLRPGVMPGWPRRGIAWKPTPLSAVADISCGGLPITPPPPPAGVLLAYDTAKPALTAASTASAALRALTPAQAACCIRVDPRLEAPRSGAGPAGASEEAGMCGFFVAVLERVACSPRQLAACLPLSPPPARVERPPPAAPTAPALPVAAAAMRLHSSAAAVAAAVFALGSGRSRRKKAGRMVPLGRR